MANSQGTGTTLSDNSRSDLVEKPEDAEPQPPDLTPPDGGLTAWLTVAGAWMVQFSTFGYLNAFGVYQDYYTRTFLSHVSPSNISWIGSVQLFLMYAPAVFVGSAFDSGYFHYVQITGSCLLVFSIFMLSLVQPDQYYQVFLAQGLGIGLGVGLLFLPSLSIVAHHFRRRRALATGLVVSGASCGGIVYPILLNHLFENPKMGFANGVRVSGGLVSGLLFIANCLMRTRLPPKRGSAIFTRHGMLHIASDGAYMWSIAGAFCTNLGLFVPFFYLQLFAVDHRVSPAITTYILAILNAGSTLGRILPMALADRLGVYNMLLPAILTSAVLLFALFGAADTGGVVAVAALFGFSSGAYVSLIPPLLGTLCTDLSELGLRMGLAFSIVGTSMLVGTPVFGALLDSASAPGSRVWWRAIVFAGVRSLPAFSAGASSVSE
ncbi:MFS general substrate transporter [Trametes versicolor FP-101664 SS1]|uniref:MFS general substrate transporter n=1 Tax=Trametes versicolor (strain FP-101664) TaxID=717944 RepID=UPI0004622227|nr:MFS general substrate transporter [Trametes versicolor FP-101664 SS1]EIW53756.1 MFS general substrate transporter [Trametes versicolor FP-101664 SS1]